MRSKKKPCDDVAPGDLREPHLCLPVVEHEARDEVSRDGECPEHARGPSHLVGARRLLAEDLQRQCEDVVDYEGGEEDVPEHDDVRPRRKDAAGVPRLLLRLARLLHAFQLLAEAHIDMVAAGAAAARDHTMLAQPVRAAFSEACSACLCNCDGIVGQRPCSAHLEHIHAVTIGQNRRVVPGPVRKAVLHVATNVATSNTQAADITAAAALKHGDLRDLRLPPQAWHRGAVVLLWVLQLLGGDLFVLVVGDGIFEDGGLGVL